MTATITLLALLFVTLLLAGYVRRVIHDDGYHGRAQQPPRSHVPDFFDPTGGPTRFA